MDLQAKLNDLNKNELIALIMNCSHVSGKIREGSIKQAKVDAIFLDEEEHEN